jgi:hypothetical protein
MRERLEYAGTESRPRRCGRTHWKLFSDEVEDPALSCGWYLLHHKSVGVKANVTHNVRAPPGTGSLDRFRCFSFCSVAHGRVNSGRRMPYSSDLSMLSYDHLYRSGHADFYSNDCRVDLQRKMASPVEICDTRSQHKRGAIPAAKVTPDEIPTIMPLVLS